MVRMMTVTGIFSENCYFYIDDSTNSGFIIDPGAQAESIYEVVKVNRWHIERILLTHGHFDHFGAAMWLHDKLDIPVYVYHSEARYLSDTYLNLSGNYPRPITVTHYEEVADGEEIRLKENPSFYLRVIHTPGHTPGSVVYYSPQDKVAFIGDSLYEHGLGLTDFPGGNRDKLEDSVIHKILTLPPDTILLSGHASPILVEKERLLLL